jgi:hypothetical protein
VHDTVFSFRQQHWRRRSPASCDRSAACAQLAHAESRSYVHILSQENCEIEILTPTPSIFTDKSHRCSLFDTHNINRPSWNCTCTSRVIFHIASSISFLTTRLDKMNPDNMLTDTSAPHIAYMLDTCINLQTLHLRQNKMTVRSKLTIAHAVARHTTLKDLSYVHMLSFDRPIFFGVFLPCLVFFS